MLVYATMTIITTKDAFQKEVLNVKNTPVLVDFFATWCGPCKMIAPILEEVAVDPKVKAAKGKIVKVDVDMAQELAQEYGVMSIPTLFVFYNGKIVKQMIGLQQKPALVTALAQAAVA